jgi:hypothetical protein
MPKRSQNNIILTINAKKILTSFKQVKPIPYFSISGTWDETAGKKYGPPRSDIQRLHKIIAGDHPEYQGKYWLDRVRKAVKAGAILPALGAYLLTQTIDQTSPDDGS